MVDKLKVLILTNLYPPQVVGGYERSIADFSRLLHQRGHQVRVLTANVPNLATPTNPHPEITVERCFQLFQGPAEGAAEGEIGMANQTALAHQLQDFGPDVCLAGNIDLLGVALLHQLLAAGVPVAHYVMNRTPNYPVEQTPNHSLHRYITCSDWIRRNLQDLGYSIGDAVVIYPGAAVEEFYQPQLPAHDQLRIAYASLVMPYKGADVLVEALSLLHSAGIEFTATVAGGTLQPEFVQALQEFIADEGLADRVQFVGVLSRSELIQLYKTHNVLAFPSRFEEPFGISQVEAMAAGLTLVTSGTGGAGEIVHPGEDGLVFESENPLALAEALSSLVANPEAWTAISQRGQQRAMADFNQHRAVEQLEAVLTELAVRRQGQPMKSYRIGPYSLWLPLEHKLDVYQATWQRYDTALGSIAQVVFDKYPATTAIDIGANVGDSAALIRSYADVPVLCVEGNPEFVTYLERNAATIGRLEIAPCFVGSGEAAIGVEQIHSHGGTASIQAPRDLGAGDTIPLKSLATLLQEYPHFQTVKLLKTDTDGFDFAIIAAAIEVIAQLQPVLYFEYDIAFSNSGVTEGLAVLQKLVDIGYDHFLVYDNFGNYLLSLSGQQRQQWVDLNAYLISNRLKSGTPAVFYLDICAFTEHDRDLFQALRQQEIGL